MKKLIIALMALTLTLGLSSCNNNQRAYEAKVDRMIDNLEEAINKSDWVTAAYYVDKLDNEQLTSEQQERTELLVLHTLTSDEFEDVVDGVVGEIYSLFE